MPAIALHPPDKSRPCDATNPLPQLLQTPSGLAIVELQGTINSTLSDEADGTTPLGRLVFPGYDPSQPDQDAASWRKTLYLYVGKHQRLTGEVKKLSKPVAVVRRKGGEASESEDLEVVEIVHYKILFAHRPEPVGGGVTG